MADGKPAGEPRQLAPSSYFQQDAEFSPDGRWIAYATNESGAVEVYVHPFPGPGEKHRVSLGGGVNPAWSPSGREIYYLKARPGSGTRIATQANAVMAANVSTAGEASGHRVLFEGPYVTTGLRSYGVTPDGEFIMKKYEENPPDQRVTRLNVVLG
jgi:serine/threonine-protein kinase